MIGLDANVIVRYLAQDDPVQSGQAGELIERRLTPVVPGFVSLVAIVETVSVLERAYCFPAHEIARAIESMLATDVFVIEREAQVFAAMTALKSDLGFFADALVGALGARAGCSVTLTFDRKASRLAHFELM